MMRELINQIYHPHVRGRADGILMHPDDKIKLDEEVLEFYQLGQPGPGTHFMGLRIHESPHVEPGKPQLVWKHLS